MIIHFMDCQMRLWQTCSQFQRKLRGRKRLVEEVDVDMVPGKRSRVGEPVIVFRTPQLEAGGIFNPPS